jgi:hypothetical protein
MTCRRSRSPTASAGHVNRPTPRAHGLRPGELQHGRALLDEKLAALHVPRVLFTLMAGAQALLGTFEGHASSPIGRLLEPRCSSCLGR